MQENKDVIEIDLKEIFYILLSKKWIIAFITIVAGVAGFLISSFLIIPGYESTTSIYILNKDTDSAITYSDAQLATQLTKDYENLIKGRTVLEQVMIEYNIEGEDYEDFADRIEVKNPTDTRIITISVNDKDPKMAQKLADRIREVAAGHIQSVTDVKAVNVADYANFPTEPATPSIPIWTVGGLAVGLLLCILIVVIKYLADDSIKTAEDIEKFLGLGTLALIPDKNYESKKRKKRREN